MRTSASQVVTTLIISILCSGRSPPILYCITLHLRFLANRRPSSRFRDRRVFPFAPSFAAPRRMQSPRSAGSPPSSFAASLPPRLPLLSLLVRRSCVECRFRPLCGLGRLDSSETPPSFLNREVQSPQSGRRPHSTQERRTRGKAWKADGSVAQGEALRTLGFPVKQISRKSWKGGIHT